MPKSASPRIRSLLAALAAALLTTEARSQGYFYFSNHVGSVVDAPVRGAEGAPLPSAGYLAELWGGASPLALAPLVDDRSRQRVFAPIDPATGYFRAANVLVLDSIGLWGWAWLQVRAWDSSLGATYEEVAALGLGGAGASPMFYGPSSGGPWCSPPCPGRLLYGLESFHVPPAAAVLIRGIRIEGDSVVVEWHPGFPKYQLQETDAPGAAWRDLGPPTATTSATNAIAGGGRFYRVLAMLR